MCKTIKQKVRFKASSDTVYRMLCDAKKQSEFTGKSAQISRRVGGPFSTLSGTVSGIMVDLVPGKRVVQAWRRSDFPEGIFSMATFDLKSLPGGGTELTLTHRGVPKALIPGVELSWREDFWNKMKAYPGQSVRKKTS